MLTGVLLAQSMDDMATQAGNLPAGLDLLELRLDYCTDLSAEQLATITFDLPLLFTLRPQSQGGRFTGSVEERLGTWMTLASLTPAFIDLEYDLPEDEIKRIAELFPKSRVILSYHNFTRMPENLEEIIQEMHTKFPSALCKIAVQAASTLDTLRLLVFAKEHKEKIIAIAMDEYGETSRILAPVFGAGFSYVPISTPSAPGQLPLDLLQTVYKYKNLGHHTKVFGLLGDPVSHSIGHIFHNELNGPDAVYVKWRITPAELPEALSLLRRLQIKGLSLTMPLKEPVLPLLDVLSPAAKIIGAVNTVVVKDQSTQTKDDLFIADSADFAVWSGENTDGQGALMALPQDIAGKKIIIIGAGGAAKAIIYAAAKQASEVLVFNRSPDKAEGIIQSMREQNADLCPMRAYALTNLARYAQDGYDVLINTLPPTAEPLSEDIFISGAVVMDISYSQESIFLQRAKDNGCVCVDGKKMFVEQALLQRTLWGLR